MHYFMLALTVSAVATLLLVRKGSIVSGRILDRDFEKPQKIHSVPVPRVGGVGIALGLMCAVLLIDQNFLGSARHLGAALMACAVPAFLSGIVHDYTDTLTPRGRLVSTAVSALLAYFVVGAAIRDTAIPGLDWLVSFAVGSAALTVLAVAGIAHAVNIIDGLNGLASMCAIIMLSAIAYVGYQVEDPLVGALALAGIGAVLGFFIWNYPSGLIFLGDGGAYFLGFYVSEISILLLRRNEGEVSPLFPLLVCIYPVFETLFSIYRRSVLRSRSASDPDGIHLHSLVYRRVMGMAVGEASAKALTRRNSASAPYLWILCCLSVVPAVLFWNNAAMLGAMLVAFGCFYVALYWRIVRFRSPKWLRLGHERAPVRCDGDNGAA